jgi:hypothetical protein
MTNKDQSIDPMLSKRLLFLVSIVCIDSILVGIDLVLPRELSIVFHTKTSPRGDPSISVHLVDRLLLSSAMIDVD